MPIAALLLFLLLTACESTVTEAEPEPQLVYPISANVADSIVLNAIRPEMERATVQRVSAPHMGYKATAVNATDTVAVLAYRIQAVGRRSNGSTTPGFLFDVRHSGDSAKAAAAAKRIRTRILAAAQREAGGLPIAPQQPED